VFDCARDMTKFHDDQVTLPTQERTAMRARRDTNRARLMAGLKDRKRPQPYLIASQGSYAMKTMVQSDIADIDIDDGVYFDRGQLVGSQGAAMTPLQVRQMIAEALYDPKFSTAPEVRENCVRVYYADGYHIDVPSYRRSQDLGRELFELAAAAWKVADARAVTGWFDQSVTRLSPAKDSDQLRRVVRLLKKFVRNRPSWKGRVASGFCITKLVTETFQGNPGADDVALRGTGEVLYRRLLDSTIVRHPVVDEYITKGNPDPKTAFLRDRLAENLEYLRILDDTRCTEADARAAWDRFFNTDWFARLPKGGTDGSGSGGPFIISGASPAAVEKRGGHGYAARR
jgi:hypothetical protein